MCRTPYDGPDRALGRTSRSPEERQAPLPHLNCAGRGRRQEVYTLTLIIVSGPFIPPIREYKDVGCR